MQNKQRLWLVSELYYPELTSTGYFVTYLAEGLAADYSVSAICGQPSYWARGTRAPWRELWHGVDVHRCRATTFDKDNLLGRAFNVMSASLSLFWEVLWQVRRDDIVIAVTNPPVLPYLVRIACKVRGSRFILLVHDVYPDVLVSLEMVKHTAFTVRLMHQASRRLYRSANRIIVLGRDMEKLIAAKLPLGDKRIVIAPNWGDVEMVYPEPREENAMLGELQIKDRFVVEYCGNIGRTHGLENIIDAAGKLAGDDRVHFLMIGWGAKREWLIEQKKQRKLQNLTVLEPQSGPGFREALNACDLALISFSPNMSGISVPSRMYNILASGKPLLAVCDHDSEVAAVVREEGIGWVVTPSHVDELVATIRHAQSTPETLRSMGKRARAAAEAKYTLKHVLAIYRSMLESLPPI